MTEILLKVALNTIKTNKQNVKGNRKHASGSVRVQNWQKDGYTR
jgi:hypothetical protein